MVAGWDTDAPLRITLYAKAHWTKLVEFSLKVDIDESCPCAPCGLHTPKGIMQKRKKLHFFTSLLGQAFDSLWSLIIHDFHSYLGLVSSGLGQAVTIIPLKSH